MKSHARVVVIGGGVVGCSVLYHLVKRGCTDVVLIERAELTAGSTWHAAAGFHSINSDPNIATLQTYTIELYRELERESGQNIGLHMTGGVNLAGTPQRWEWLKAAWAVFQSIGATQARLMTPKEIKELCPIADIDGIWGGLYDPNEGYVDPHGTTHAYASAARRRGAEIMLHTRVIDLRKLRDGSWLVETEHGNCTAEHVVNAAGLWAKQVGRMVGVDLPVVPMEHHYLVTEPLPELAALGRELPITVDLEGFTYLRQEGKGVLLGVYELRPKHWSIDGAPWDYGMELIPEDIDRIYAELCKGFARFPSVQRAGIKRWVNGPITFTPDGNPLVGPVPGLSGYWVACGVMAGFSQAGGVGRILAEWIVDGEPSVDAFGMDIARYGEFASNRTYLMETTAQFYSRRFVLTYPNEQLPAGRPLRRSGAHQAMNQSGARWGSSFGLEIPVYFAPAGFIETPSLRRSEVHEIVGSECRRSRSAVGLLDTSGFSRILVRGPRSREWLDRILAGALPPPGRIRIAPMLSPSGRLLGDFTVFCWEPESWWIMGSYHLRSWHLRWLRSHLAGGGVYIEDVSDSMAGFSLFGPRSRELVARLTASDVSNGAFPFMTCRSLDVGLMRGLVGRLSITGELGFEINVPAVEHLTLYETLMKCGQDFGIVPVGYNAAQSLRMEKSYGIWGREFAWGYTPRMNALGRFVNLQKGDFIGREAFSSMKPGDEPLRLVTLEVTTHDADASGFEPVWSGSQRVGFVTSGAYGYTVEKSLALAYVRPEYAREGSELEVHIVGERRSCKVTPASPVDPSGLRMRS